VPLLAAEGDGLRGYVGEHLRLSSVGGAAWPIEVGALSIVTLDGGGYLRAQVRFVAPPGAARGALEFFDDAILHRVVTHRTLVSVRRDFDQAMFGDAPRLVGVLLFSQKQITIHREAGSVWRGFRALFLLGARHIAEGTDHLLFLFVLLLIAPLSVIGGRWAGVRSARETLRSMLLVVSAFTVGHSVSLAASALGWLLPPSQPIEVLVGVSIVVTACHALRPFTALARGREPLMAAGFGLVHGFAFATALRAFGFQGSTLALALLGFNLGIEAMQLAIVLLVVPWLFLLRGTALYSPLRIATASSAIIAALGWIAERVTGATNIVTRSLIRLSPLGWVALALLVGLALIVTIFRSASKRARMASAKSPAVQAASEARPSE
jgi:hypothetical protein